MKRITTLSALLLALFLAMGTSACGPKGPHHGHHDDAAQGQYCPKHKKAGCCRGDEEGRVCKHKKMKCDGQGPDGIVCPHKGPCPGGEACPHEANCPGGDACPYKSKCKGGADGVCAQPKKKCEGNPEGVCPRGKPHICADGEPCTNQCTGKCDKPDCPYREGADDEAPEGDAAAPAADAASE
ncbi:MAG: hypothetical protein KDH09_20150 [Chrysiogenetes bacterium]|nr:hypothetical protein [Chrysiogenetes bacterium]